MSIRFAAARLRPVAEVVFAPAIEALPVPANDHEPYGEDAWANARERLLRRALSHFAAHGLAAAARARDNARDAHKRGDIGACAQWLDICRTLDRRMADATIRDIHQRD